MAGPSPMRDGFRNMFRQPSAGAIEVLWRWSFYAFFWLLIIFCFTEYLKSLPVTKEQILLIGSGQSFLVLRALQQIFHGSVPRLLRAVLVLALTAGVGWIILASFGRAATLRRLMPPAERIPAASLFGLNLLRALAFAGSIFISLGILVLLSLTQDPSLAAQATFPCFMLIIFIWFVWSFWNWFFSSATIFVAKEDCRTFPALRRFSRLCVRRFGSVLFVSFCFWLVRIIIFCALAVFCLLLIGIAPSASEAVLAAILACFLGYSLLFDFLYVGRLAAYLAISDLPDPAPLQALVSYPTEGNPPPDSTRSPIDPDELILSDIPQPS
jgi:hypothetical protein